VLWCIARAYGTLTKNCTQVGLGKHHPAHGGDVSSVVVTGLDRLAAALLTTQVDFLGDLPLLLPPLHSLLKPQGIPPISLSHTCCGGKPLKPSARWLKCNHQQYY
jgi:hypothetical protein